MENDREKELKARSSAWRVTNADDFRSGWSAGVAYGKARLATLETERDDLRAMAEGSASILAHGGEQDRELMAEIIDQVLSGDRESYRDPIDLRAAAQERTEPPEDEELAVTRRRQFLADVDRDDLPEGAVVRLCTRENTQNVHDWGLWWWSLGKAHGGHWDGYASSEADALRVAFSVDDALTQ